MSTKNSKVSSKPFLKVPAIDKNLLPNGIYHVRFPDGVEYRAEKMHGDWYLSDGTGWKDKFPKSQCFTVLRFYEFK